MIDEKVENMQSDAIGYMAGWQGRPVLIVMLTYNDRTVDNAFEVFEKSKDSQAVYWGFKEEPLPPEQMKKLYAYMKQCGKKTVLEVVAYTEEECLKGAFLAAECGCDLLMGTLFFDSVNDYCRQVGMKYMPFVGKITGRPSVLEGTVDEMIRDAKAYLEKGVYGFDLLGYRYVGDPVLLNKKFVSEINAPVCIAGSIDSYQRLDEVKAAAPWAFTIGSAFFDHKFGEDFTGQINNVCEYIEK